MVGLDGNFVKTKLTDGTVLEIYHYCGTMHGIFRSVSEMEVKNKEVEAMKRQSDGLTTEYDRLLREHEKLQVSTL